MEINENIKILCKIRGLSFAELADRLNVTRQTLYRQSTGSAQLATLERIAAALQVPVFILVHPAPAAALLSWNGRQATGHTPVLSCPYCSRPIYIHAATAAQEAHDRTGEQDENREGQTDQDERPGTNRKNLENKGF